MTEELFHLPKFFWEVHRARWKKEVGIKEIPCDLRRLKPLCHELTRTTHLGVWLSTALAASFWGLQLPPEWH